VETIYFARGCLWGVQHFIKSLPGIIMTEAGRANGRADSLEDPYDGYAECEKLYPIRTSCQWNKRWRLGYV